jgi:hypothetical protein
MVMFLFLVETFYVPVILRRMDPLHKVYDEFLQKCVKNFDEVLYIAGNHEAYGYNTEGTWNVLAEHLPKGIHILENDFVKSRLGISWSNSLD